MKSVDWNELISEQENTVKSNNSYDNELTKVEKSESSQYAVSTPLSEEEQEDGDVLNIQESMEVDITEDEHVEVDESNVSSPKSRHIAPNGQRGHYTRNWDDRTETEVDIRLSEQQTPDQPTGRQRKKRRTSKPVNCRKREVSRRECEKYVARNQATPNSRTYDRIMADIGNESPRGWRTRWMRRGYENVVYDIYNSIETPYVVFAALCYTESDVYTMVLRNCNGTRRYWYHKPSRNSELPRGELVDDFQIAIRQRSGKIGRVANSPGYDLAAFVLQNVSTDKRCGGDDYRITTAPLIVVTTENMLTEQTLKSQLLYSHSTETRGHASRSCPTDRKEPVTCCECDSVPGIVTYDNASIPYFTCWRHANRYLVGAGSDSVRVYNACIVDLQFSSDGQLHSTGDGLECHLRLVGRTDEHRKSRKGRSVKENVVDLRIAELVSSTQLPESSQSYSQLSTSSLQLAHDVSGCTDSHYCHEDYLPSDQKGRGVTFNHDTQIGRVVDTIHCTVSTFQ